jgi:hypothetical protein
MYTKVYVSCQWALRIYAEGFFLVHLPEATSIKVLAEFIAMGQERKLEVLMRETSGNQTGVETCFASEYCPKAIGTTQT